jgi:hypothetical protein
MIGSDKIIKDLPEVEYLTFDNKQISSFCGQVVDLKDIIFKINEFNIININDLVSYLGNTERHIGNNYAKNIIETLEKMNIPRHEFGGKNSIERMSKINTDLKITVNLYTYLDEFYIEKKYKIGSDVKKTYIKILNPELVGTGNLSTSLILKATYFYKENDKFKTKNVCFKVYPLEIYNQPQYSGLGANNIDNLKTISKYIAVREGLIGCWVNTHLLNKNLYAHPITNTIMSVTDIFFTKGKNLEFGKNIEDGTGLPFTYEQLKTKIYNLTTIKQKYGKNWVNNNLETKDIWKEKIAKKQYGYIEMEPIDYTLSDIIDKKLFTLDMLFEIIYTKLCLQIIGNVTTPDDHSDNIMTSLCSNVRKYIIKSRGHEFNFFISDPNKIKYIDLERTDILYNRNYLDGRTAFVKYYNGYFNTTIKGYTDAQEKIYGDMIISALFRNQLNLNRFCEFMNKILPDKYTDESLYVNKIIEEYYLDLDVLDDTLKLNMLFQPRAATDISKGIPYKLWNGTLEFPPLPIVSTVPVVGGNKQMYKLKI